MTDQLVGFVASGDKKVSAYNLYIKEEIPKIKAANPGIEHMVLFISLVLSSFLINHAMNYVGRLQDGRCQLVQGQGQVNGIPTCPAHPQNPLFVPSSPSPPPTCANEKTKIKMKNKKNLDHLKPPDTAFLLAFDSERNLMILPSKNESKNPL